MADITHNMVVKMKDMTVDIAELRDNIANFDDFFRPIRNYFYWEPHCYNIPVCWSIRSIFDTLDGIDVMTDDIQELIPDMERLDALMPQMVAMMPEMIATMKNMKTDDADDVCQTQKGMQDQMAAMQDNSIGHGRGVRRVDERRLVLSAAGGLRQRRLQTRHGAVPLARRPRGAVHHQPRGRSAVARGHRADRRRSRTPPRRPSRARRWRGRRSISAAPPPPTRTCSDGTNYDLLIAGIAALALIFIIMLIITRAIVAAAVIVGTVVLSLGASFGLSVLIWQHLLGIELHWMVLAMSVIILLAVGADYNLLLVSRFKEEIHAGLETGIIRAMGGTGSVVTSAGLVFAFTMMSMAVSELTVIGQVGTTIGLGLLFDTLVIRSFMTPSIAALLGKWFWWPKRVRERPLPSPWPSPDARSPVSIDR